MNPFLLAPQARLGHWKEFRRLLTTFPEAQQIDAVAQYWAQAPLDKHAYDLEDAASLPTAWEMISLGSWCRSSVAIGMEFTLRLAGWSPDRLAISMIRDWDLSEMFLMLIIDDRQVLNYSYGQVAAYPTSRHDICGCWRYNGKQYVGTDARAPVEQLRNFGK